MATRNDRRLRRLRDDFAYWAKHCYRIRDKDQAIVPLVFNHAQRVIDAKMREARAAIRHGRLLVYILKARQGGVSTAEQARNLHTIWSTPGANVMTLAHTRVDTDKIFKITARAIDHFPDGLNHAMGKAATREVSYPSMDASFWTGTAGSRSSGRGTTLMALHGSEFAFWEDPDATLGAIMPGIVPGGRVILETTASAHGSPAHERWLAAENGLNDFLPIFLPWWICDHEKYRIPLLADDELGKLEPDEQRLVDHHGLDLEQIKWRRSERRALGPATFRQEFAEDPESCWLVAGDLFYSGDTLVMLQDLAPQPGATVQLKYGGWYGKATVFKTQEEVRPAWNAERVIIGVDVAEGGAGDRSAYVARTFPSWDLLEQFADNTVEPKALAAVLNDRGKIHADKQGPALLVVEKNAHGITVLRELRDTHKYPSSRLYHRTKFDRDTKEPKLELGWATTGESKPLLLDAGRELFNGARDELFDVPSIECIRDGFNVTRDDKGKVELNGRDVLVAEALAWQGRTYAAGGYGSFTEYL